MPNSKFQPNLPKQRIHYIVYGKNTAAGGLFEPTLFGPITQYNWHDNLITFIFHSKTPI